MFFNKMIVLFHFSQIKNLLKTSGDSFPLLGSSGTTWGKVRGNVCILDQVPHKEACKNS